jgi:uncharacterized protein
MTDDGLSKRHAKLQDILVAIGPMAIAFSGGVDSSFLLRVARDAVPGQVAAFFADSPVQPAGEKDEALALAKEIGVPLRVISFDLLADSKFIANSSERCYFCKKGIFTAFQKLCSGSEKVLLDGTNLDDLQEVRPGFKACQELGVRSPLLESGLTKADIRRLSQELGLPTWNKPSASCLATRISEGHEITAAALTVVNRGEEWLHRQGFSGCRLRLRDKVGIIELSAGGISRFVSEKKWPAALEYMSSLGIQKVFLDLSEREGILS